MLIKFDKFPDGQTHLKLPRSSLATSFPVAHTRIRNFEDIGKLYLLQDILTHQVDARIQKLKIYWQAGSRWDRREYLESFDVKVFATLLNELNIPRIEILDPHSYAICAAVNHAEEMSIGYSFYGQFPENKDKLLVIPDAGAQKRGEKFLAWQGKTEHIQCLKTRFDKDRLSISCFAPHYDIAQLIQGRDLIIVDDICDGGATFIAIAKQLEQYRPKSFSLMVTHGIFSKGFCELNCFFTQIYTTNSFVKKEHLESQHMIDRGNSSLHVYEIFNPTEDINEYFIID